MKPLLIMAALAALPVSAQARNMENMMTVKALPGGGQEFEVLNHPGSGPQDYWCAAGAYAQRDLGLGPFDRIYLVQGRAPAQTRPGWQAVTFTTDSQHPVVAMLPDGGKSDLFLSLTKKGYALSSDSARQYCFDGVDIELIP